MSLTFFYSPDSSAVTCHMALEELGIPYEKQRIDLAAGDNHTPSFHALNPNEKVPTLVHDGVPVFESAAIIAYLGETFGVDKGLWPAAGPKRGEALAWTVWTNATLHEAMSRHQHASSPRLPKEGHNAKAAELAKAEVVKLLGLLEERLATRAYVLGESYSLVDVHLGGWVGYASMLGFDLKPFPKTAAWLGKVASRPAFATAMKPAAA